MSGSRPWCDPQESLLRRWEDLLAPVTSAPGSALPLHTRISQLLVRLIESGVLSDGDALPPERLVAQICSVSIAPVRQAILETLNAGLLVRQRGVGTFVRAPSVDDKLSILSLMTASPRDQQVHVANHVIHQAIVPTPAPIARALQMRRGMSAYLERVAVLGREPVALLQSHLAARAYPGLTRIPLGDHSLHSVLRERYDTVITSAESVIDFTRCTTSEADKLDVEPGEPLLRVEGVAFAETRQPVEHYRIVYRANRVRFHLQSDSKADGSYVY